MKSKTSFSENSLFRRCLGRYWPLTLLMLLVLILFVAADVGSTLSSAVRYEHLLPDALRDLARQRVFEDIRYTVLYAALFALGTAMAVFEHTYSPRLSGLFASLPVKRQKIFSQHWLAGLWMMLSVGIVAFGALLAVETVNQALDPVSALQWLAVYSMECVTFYGIASFCVMLTGHVLVIPALYALVNVAASALNLLLVALVQQYTYGVDGMNHFTWMHAFSPLVKLVDTVSPNRYVQGIPTVVHGWGWLGLYCAVGIVFALLAMLLFRRRQLERALDTTAFPVLRPILKYIITVFFALGVPFLVLFFSSNFSFYGDTSENLRFFPAHLLLTLAGAVLGYFGSEMIIHKSLRVSSVRGWCKALLVGALCCGLVCLFRFDAFGIARRVPAPETVRQVELNVGGGNYLLTEPESVEAVEAIHRDCIVRGPVESDWNGRGSYLMLTYLLNNGNTVVRSYYVPAGEALTALEEAVNAPAIAPFIRELNPPVPMDADHVMEGEISTGADLYLGLTGAQALSLYEEAIRPDAEEGLFGPVDLAFGPEYAATHYNGGISIYVRDDDGRNYILDYTPTPETRRTNAWLEAHGANLVLIRDAEAVG